MDNCDFYLSRPCDLERQTIAQMYYLYSQYYDATNADIFEQDLNKKTKVLLITNNHKIIGFSTILQFETNFEQRQLQILFSGDTIMHQQFWGNPILAFSWLRFAGSAKAERPTLPLYWFIIVKGHRTYRYLPTFSKNFFPNYRQTTPAFEQGLMDKLAKDQFGNNYDCQQGIIRFEHSQGHLKKTYAAIPDNQAKRKDIAFFVERNPNYTRGEELVCLCELSVENLKPLSKRIFLDGYKNHV